VSYGLTSGPASATINPTTGLLSWTPSLADVGTANLVVSATNNNAWGTTYVTLSFPVYFADAPTVTGVSSSVDPVSGVTTWTVAWTAPTLNTASIAGYQITVTDASAPAATPPTVYTVSAASLSVAISNAAVFHGTVQVTAFDALGNLSVTSALFTF
jgi:hypothetical protein